MGQEADRPGLGGGGAEGHSIPNLMPFSYGPGKVGAEADPEGVVYRGGGGHTGPAGAQ